MTVCSCLYPLHIIDKRYSVNSKDWIEYLAIPQEVIDEMDGKINIPGIKSVKEEGSDGIVRKYVEVEWTDPNLFPGAMTKRYDVNDHIMTIGCDAPKCKISTSGKSGSKHKDGSVCKCDEKEVYKVLHPYNEWHSHHIVEINSIK